MDKDLEVVLWMVSVQLHDMRINIKNGLPIDMEILDGIINGIEAVMNGSEGETSNDASALPIPDVSKSLLHKRDTNPNYNPDGTNADSNLNIHVVISM